MAFPYNDDLFFGFIIPVYFYGGKFESGLL
jgi:hypothetical protein